jgi:type 1 glutamine amidotransferase
MKKALLFGGGWEGHHPERIIQLFAEALRGHGLATDLERSLDCLADADRLKGYDLIFPCWTMGQLSKPQTENLLAAVHGGVGLGGLHGGMGDAFRGNTSYEWMVGGHFVGHPHVGDYPVAIRDFASPITAGLPGEFAYRSEQYYLLVDPGVHVLADTPYLYEGRRVTMPVAWVKRWGRGRVFYSSLGHQPEEFTQFPEAMRLSVQGLLWAAGVL